MSNQLKAKTGATSYKFLTQNYGYRAGFNTVIFKAMSFITNHNIEMNRF